MHYIFRLQGTEVDFWQQNEETNSSDVKDVKFGVLTDKRKLICCSLDTTVPNILKELSAFKKLKVENCYGSFSFPAFSSLLAAPFMLYRRRDCPTFDFHNALQLHSMSKALLGQEKQDVIHYILQFEKYNHKLLVRYWI